jgi:hypothetical protein
VNDKYLTDLNEWKLKSRRLLDNGQGKKTTTAPVSDDHDHISLAAVPHILSSTSSTTNGGGDGTNAVGGETRVCTVAVSTAQTVDDSLRSKDTTPSGLLPPMLSSCAQVTGLTTPRLRIENKRSRRKLQQSQPQPEWWTTHEGNFRLPRPLLDPPPTHRNNMCPRGLALLHPAAATLQQYAMHGCPTNTGKPWTLEQIQTAMDRGPHVSALVPEAMAALDVEVAEKVANGQARLIRWNDIRHAPPPQLNISPVAMVPHNSRAYRAILDLSFPVHLNPSTTLPSVNSSTTKTAPKAAIDQIGHVLPRIIHAFATAEDDAKIFMAKWDIKDGFWRLDCEVGEEWNFCYVLPSSFGSDDIVLVVPTSLQMGWIESPPYFCAASETARDVAALYAERPLDGKHQQHSFLHYTQTHEDYRALPTSRRSGDAPVRYLMEVYVDDFMDIVIPVCQQDLDHIAAATMMGIHDVFPPSSVAATDPISEKKLLRGEGAWANVTEILGMTFDGSEKTIWLAEEKRNALLLMLKTWLQKLSKRIGIAFSEFRTTLSKLQHAFLTVPAGRGLLSAFYKILATQPALVYLHTNPNLKNAVLDCRTFLRDTISTPTKCRNLVTGWPDYVSITDASGHGLGGVIIGENKEVPPVVFRLQWPADITASIVSDTNPEGAITNSDLEMAGLLMLWLVMEDVCDVENAHVALFSDNSPTVHWVQRLGAKNSAIAMQLIRALALRLQLTKASPLTPMHIAGVNNSLTDIPSRSFGSDTAWHCHNDTELLMLFNLTFPLPNQGSWTVFHLSSEIAMRVISILRMKAFTADEWRRLPKKGRLIGSVGSPMSSLWEWTHTFNKRHTSTEFVPCLDLPQESDPAPMAADSKYELARSVAQSRPLARRSLWPMESTQQK